MSTPVSVLLAALAGASAGALVVLAFAVLGVIGGLIVSVAVVAGCRWAAR